MSRVPVRPLMEQDLFRPQKQACVPVLRGQGVRGRTRLHQPRGKRQWGKARTGSAGPGEAASPGASPPWGCLPGQDCGDSRRGFLALGTPPHVAEGAPAGCRSHPLPTLRTRPGSSLEACGANTRNTEKRLKRFQHDSGEWRRQKEVRMRRGRAALRHCEVSPAPSQAAACGGNAHAHAKRRRDEGMRTEEEREGRKARTGTGQGPDKSRAGAEKRHRQLHVPSAPRTLFPGL